MAEGGAVRERGHLSCSERDAVGVDLFEGRQYKTEGGG